MDVRVGLWRRLSAEELMLLNCGVGEDSWESLGLQGDPTSPFWKRSALGFLWREWCWSWNSSTSPLGNCKYHCCELTNTGVLVSFWTGVLFFFFFCLYTWRRAFWAATLCHTGPNCAQMTKSRSLEQAVPVFILPRPNLGFLGNYLFLCNWNHLSKAHIKKQNLARIELANTFH